MLQIIPSIIFAQGTYVVQDCTIGKDNFQSDAVGMQRVIFDKMNASRISGKVTTNLARALSSKIKRHQIAFVMEVRMKVLENASCLACQNAI
jgi:hypothetical protein